MSKIIEMLKEIAENSNEICNVNKIEPSVKQKFEFNFRKQKFTIWDDYPNEAVCSLIMHAKKGDILFSTMQHDLENYKDLFKSIKEKVISLFFESDFSLNLIKEKKFKYAVITKINSLNLADSAMIFDRKQALEFLLFNGEGFFNMKNNLKMLRKNNRNEYFYIGKIEVFSVGEILMVDPEFHREVLGPIGKCPRKWDVEYELFDSNQLEMAYIRSKELITSFYERST